MRALTLDVAANSPKRFLHRSAFSDHFKMNNPLLSAWAGPTPGTRDVQAQSARATIQSGFLFDRKENAFPSSLFPLVNALSAWSDSAASKPNVSDHGR